LLYNEVSNKNIINSNHRANLKIEYKIDSANSITVQPRITFQLNDQDAVTVGKNESGNILISNTNTKLRHRLMQATLPCRYCTNMHSIKKAAPYLNLTPASTQIKAIAIYTHTTYMHSTR
jgi:hypothetical protein